MKSSLSTVGNKEEEGSVEDDGIEEGIEDRFVFIVGLGVVGVERDGDGAGD